MTSAQPHLVGLGGLVIAATPGAGEVLTLFVWFVLVAVIALSGFYIAIAIRRWSQREVRPATFTFQDLRNLRASGQINDREFAAMRVALLAELALNESAEAELSGATPRSATDDMPDGGAAREPEDDGPPAPGDAPPSGPVPPVP